MDGIVAGKVAIVTGAGRGIGRGVAHDLARHGATVVVGEFVPRRAERIKSELDDIGGPHSHSNIPWGWAQAGNTPLRWYKQNTYGGGVRDPLIVHWPARIGDRGAVHRASLGGVSIASVTTR